MLTTKSSLFTLSRCNCIYPGKLLEYTHSCRQRELRSSVSWDRCRTYPVATRTTVVVRGEDRCRSCAVPLSNIGSAATWGGLCIANVNRITISHSDNPHPRPLNRNTRSAADSSSSTHRISETNVAVTAFCTDTVRCYTHSLGLQAFGKYVRCLSISCDAIM